MKKLLFILILLTPITANGQKAAEYICDKFDGSISKLETERSFIGDTYTCSVENQWDMQIMSDINHLIITDDNFTDSRPWRKDYVDTKYFSRRTMAFEKYGFNTISIYVPFEQKTDHFIIAE